MTEAHPLQDISDQVWERLRPLLPGEAGSRGRSAQDNRRYLNAVSWILLTGSPWRDLPTEYGDWKNTHRRFCRWRDRGVWASILDGVLDDPALEWPMTIIANRLRARLHEAAAPAGNQAVALTSRHPPDSPPGSLNHETSATLPRSSRARTMRDGAVGTECRRCGSTHVVKNGRRGDRQQNRCQSGRCGHQFNDSANAFNQRFPAEMIAKSIELRLRGLPYKDVAAEAGSITGAKIAESTVLGWVEKYVGLAGAGAANEVRKLTEIEWRFRLAIEYTSLHPVNGGCWLAQDVNTGYVLAALACRSFDPDTAREVIAEVTTKVMAPKFPYLYAAFNFTLQTGAESRRSDGYRDVESAIRQQLHSTRYIRPEDFEPEDFLANGPGCAFRIPLQIMRKRGFLRSPESRQQFLDGWVVMHNFFDRDDHPRLRVPADEAGLGVPFRSWLDVVNCRVKRVLAGDRSS